MAVLPEQSLWAATAAPLAPFVPLHGVTRASVAIVGAGFTGLSAALHLSEAGRDVVVLDTLEVGEGASGLNGGQVIPGLKYDPDVLETMFPGVAGERLVSTIASGPDLVFKLIERHGIDCEATRSGWLQAATSEPALATLMRRVAAWSARGAPIEMLDRSRFVQLTGSQRYSGGLLDRRGGSVQPLGYVRGLALAATRAGARIHTQSAVRRLERAGSGWRLITANGEVVAERVVLATNGYTDGLLEPLRRSVVAVPSMQVATAPLSTEVLRWVLPQRQAVSDTWRLLRYFRLNREGRLVMGSRGVFGDVPLRDAAGLHYRAVRDIYPELGELTFEHHWAGWVAMTQDHLPHLHEAAPGVICGLGYNGRGVAMATQMGATIARWILGEDIANLGFPVTPLKPIRLHRFSRLGVACMIQYYRLLDRLHR